MYFLYIFNNLGLYLKKIQLIYYVSFDLFSPISVLTAEAAKNSKI